MASFRSRSREVGADRELLVGPKGSSLSVSVGASDGSRPSAVKSWIRVAACSVLLIAVILLAVGFKTSKTSPFQHDSFITVNGTQFMHKGRPFYVVGFNVDNLSQAMLVGAMSRADAAGSLTGVDAVRDVMMTAARAGLNTVRTWAHTTDPSRPFQTGPGKYDERVFSALDRVIAEAERAGLRVILSLVDNWKYEGGVDEFVDWAPTVPKRDAAFPVATKGDGDVSVEAWSEERTRYEAQRKTLFYTDAGVKKLFKAHVHAVLDRVNTVSGRRYREDPTVLGYDLLNEPRCDAYVTPGCADLLTAWVSEMAAYVKSMDRNHLLTLGSEGFWGPGDADAAYNPGAAQGSDWASKTGQDFGAQSSVEGIDFATVHVWPDNWKTTDTEFLHNWIERHVDAAAKSLGKPVLLEEFGKKLDQTTPTEDAIIAQRDPVYRAVYAEAEASIGAAARGGHGASLAGTMFWRWGYNAWNAWAVGEYGVLPADATFRVVRGHAKRVKALQNTSPPRTGECWVGAARLGIARCELQPAACQAQGVPESLRGRGAVAGGRLQPPSTAETFGSHAECCLAGLGAFEDGCHTKI